MIVGQTVQRFRFLVRALTLTATRRRFDVLDELESDHIRIEMLFLALRLSDDRKEWERAFYRLKRSLTLHIQLEESIFYPACARHEELREKIAESLEEHQQIKRALSDIHKLDPKDETSRAHIKVLFDEVEHHVGEEERHLFPVVRRYLSISELERMAEKVRATRKRAQPKRAPIKRGKAPAKVAA